jgi:hypothetical protein
MDLETRFQQSCNEHLRTSKDDHERWTIAKEALAATAYHMPWVGEASVTAAYASPIRAGD